jgi:hypothetical protein
MSIVLKRPMFRKGGSVAKGSGIEAGLTHRKRFAGGDLATSAATGDNDTDFSRIENMDFSSDDTSDFDDYMLAHALSSDKNITTDDTDIMTGISPTKSIEGTSFKTPSLSDILVTPAAAGEKPQVKLGPDGFPISKDILTPSDQYPENSTTGTMGKTSGIYTPGATNAPRTSGENQGNAVNPYSQPKNDSMNIYNQILKAGLITPEQHTKNMWASWAASAPTSPLELQTWGTAAGKAARELQAVETPQETAAKKYASLAAIKDISNKTVNPTVLQNKASMWALLNSQDPNFKNLSKQEQDQKVLAEIQKRKDENAQIQKAPSPAAEQNKIYDKTLTDLEKDRFGRRLNTEQRENYASFIVNKDRYMQQGYDFAQDPMIKDREKELKIEGNIITLTNPNNLVNYIPNKDYVLPSGNKNTPPRIYRFDGQKFILNNNPASFRNQQSSKQVIQ